MGKGEERNSTESHQSWSHDGRRHKRKNKIQVEEWVLKAGASGCEGKRERKERSLGQRWLPVCLWNNITTGFYSQRWVEDKKIQNKNRVPKIWAVGMRDRT